MKTNTLISIVDFDENGGASIQIPQIQSDYSLIINHWEDAAVLLDKVEKDLLAPDSAQRRAFLKKVKNVLSDFINRGVFSCDDVSSEDDDCIISDERFEGWSDSDFENAFSEGVNKNWDFGNQNLSEKEKEYNLKTSKVSIAIEVGYESNDYDEDGYNIEYLTVYNYQLKHSLGWYLMGRVDNEMAKTKSHIEVLHGLLRVLDNIDRVVMIIRESKSPFASIGKLMEEFDLSKLQAEAILRTALKELTTLDKKHIISQIEEFTNVISVLEKLG